MIACLFGIARHTGPVLCFVNIFFFCSFCARDVIGRIRCLACAMNSEKCNTQSDVRSKKKKIWKTKSSLIECVCVCDASLSLSRVASSMKYFKRHNNDNEWMRYRRIYEFWKFMFIFHSPLNDSIVVKSMNELLYNFLVDATALP